MPVGHLFSKVLFISSIRSLCLPLIASTLWLHFWYDSACSLWQTVYPSVLFLLVFSSLTGMSSYLGPTMSCLSRTLFMLWLLLGFGCPWGEHCLACGTRWASDLSHWWRSISYSVDLASVWKPAVIASCFWRSHSMSKFVLWDNWLEDNLTYLWNLALCSDPVGSFEGSRVHSFGKLFAYRNEMIKGRSVVR